MQDKTLLTRLEEKYEVQTADIIRYKYIIERQKIYKLQTDNQIKELIRETRNFRKIIRENKRLKKQNITLRYNLELFKRLSKLLLQVQRLLINFIYNY